MKKITLNSPVLKFLVPNMPFGENALKDTEAGLKTGLDVAPWEGTHYYAFTKDIGYDIYTKARATITLPTDINWGPAGRKRNAYISLGVANTMAGVSVDLGLQNKAGAGWTLCIGGSEINDAKPDTTFLTGITTLTLIAEDMGDDSYGNRVVKVSAYSGVYDGLSSKVPLAELSHTTKSPNKWDRLYRFASLMYSQTDNPYDDGSKMMNVKFSNLALYNSKTKKFENWGIATDLMEFVWIINYPCGSFTDKSTTATSEIFNINNSWTGPVIVNE